MRSQFRARRHRITLVNRSLSIEVNCLVMMIGVQRGCYWSELRYNVNDRPAIRYAAVLLPIGTGSDLGGRRSGLRLFKTKTERFWNDLQTILQTIYKRIWNDQCFKKTNLKRFWNGRFTNDFGTNIFVLKFVSFSFLFKRFNFVRNAFRTNSILTRSLR